MRDGNGRRKMGRTSNSVIAGSTGLRSMREAMRRQADLKTRGITESDVVLDRSIEILAIDAMLDARAAEINIAATQAAHFAMVP